MMRLCSIILTFRVFSSENFGDWIWNFELKSIWESKIREYQILIKDRLRYANKRSGSTRFSSTIVCDEFNLLMGHEVSKRDEKNEILSCKIWKQVNRVKISPVFVGTGIQIKWNVIRHYFETQNIGYKYWRFLRKVQKLKTTHFLLFMFLVLPNV